MAYRNYGVANNCCIGEFGNFPTITRALASPQAVSGTVFYLYPGVYTENFTMPAGTFTISTLPGSEEGCVTIVGKISLPSAGSYSFSGIRFQTNNDFSLQSTGSGSQYIFANNSYFYSTNATSVSINNANAELHMHNSIATVATNGVTFGTFASNAGIWLRACQFYNPGFSSTRTNCSAGYINITNCQSYIGFSSSGSGHVDVTNSNISPYTSLASQQVNLEAYVHNSSDVTSTIFNSVLSSGSASAVTINSGSVTLENNTIFSTNTNAISGAGTLITGSNDFLSSSGISTSITNSGSSINSSVTILPSGALNVNTGATVDIKSGAILQVDAGASTRLPLSGLIIGKGAGNAITALPLTTNGQLAIGGASGPVAATLTAGADISITNGANSIAIAASFTSTTWTPVLAFGGGSTGITYSVQTGKYTKVGNVVFFGFTIILTNKGSSTGNATISGLPIAAASGVSLTIGYLVATTFTGVPFAQITGGMTSMTLLQSTLGTLTNLTDTAFTNSSQIQLEGFYFTS